MKHLKLYESFLIEKTSKAAQEFISKKISKLHDEGYEGKQAIAIAFSYARKAGYDIPEPNESLEEYERFRRSDQSDQEDPMDGPYITNAISIQGEDLIDDEDSREIGIELRQIARA